MSDLQLQLFGTPTLTTNGQPLALTRRKALALLVYVTVTGTAHRREALATMLWPEHSESQGRGYLRRELAALTKTLGDGVLMADREQIGLASAQGIGLDVHAFRRTLAACRTHNHPLDRPCSACRSPLTEAIDLYRGDFLAGFTLADSPNFDDWQFFQAESLRGELASALDRLVQTLVPQGEFGESIEHVRRRLTLDPLHEPAHQQLMRLYSWTGQHANALRQFDACSDLLVTELDVPPDDETRQLYEEIKARRLPVPTVTNKDTASPKPLLASPADLEKAGGFPQGSMPRLRLPRQSTQFVGRAIELEELHRLLFQVESCRLLTILGPGGMGKTRLAIQAATDSQEQFPDGTFFVDLAAINSPDFLAASIADALNISIAGATDPSRQLLNFLRDKAALLVLDNYEHLLPEVDLVVDLLAETDITVLVTTRERLNLQEEWLFSLYGLPVPTLAESSADIESSDAVQLFVQRISRTQPGFRLDNQNQRDVAQICRLVDGMPLGLELAAAWGRMLSCAEIVAEIEGSLDFLASSLRDIPERHRNLRAVFEQSWQMLTTAEQEMFARLSVFQGGFRRRAAVRVAQADLLELSELVDKSLLRRTRRGRYVMHELLRQFAAEKLTEQADVRAATHKRHTDYFAGLLEGRLPNLKGSGQKEALREITAEIDNVRSAWRRMADEHDGANINRTAEPLMQFYEMKGWFQEGEAVFRLAKNCFLAHAAPSRDHALAAYRCMVYHAWLQVRLGHFSQGHQGFLLAKQFIREQGLDNDETRAIIAVWYAYFLHGEGSDEESERRHFQAIELYHSRSATFELGQCYGGLGMIYSQQARLDEAESNQNISVQYLESLGDVRYQSFAVGNLALIALRRGAFDKAEDLAQRALHMRQEMGDQVGLGLSYSQLGYVAEAKGGYALAEQHHHDAAILHEQAGNDRFRAFCITDQALPVLAQGEVKRAEEMCEEGLATFRLLEDPIGIATALYNLAEVAMVSGRFAYAQNLHQQSLALRQEKSVRIGITLSLNGVGRAALANGDAAVAADSFLEALSIGQAFDLRPIMLDAILGLIQLHELTSENVTSNSVASDSVETTLPHLRFVLQHPSSPARVRTRAQELLEERAKRLPAGTNGENEVAARTLTLEQVAQEFLAERE